MALNFGSMPSSSGPAPGGMGGFPPPEQWGQLLQLFGVMGGEPEMAPPAPAPNQGLFGNKPNLSEIDNIPLPNNPVPTTEADPVPEFFRKGSTPPVDTTNDEMTFGDRANNFFGNLDQHMESPSKILGLGLLGQIDPRLARLALIGGGLFGNNKVM